MDKFKGKVKKRTYLLSLVTLLMGIIYFLLPVFQNNFPQMPDFTRGFQAGAFCGLELILVFFTVKNLISLKNDKTLKKLYIEETDERNIMIYQRTGAAGMTICIICLGAASIVAGFLNQAVFYTLLSATIFTALIKSFYKIYYNIKF